MTRAPLIASLLAAGLLSACDATPGLTGDAAATARLTLTPAVADGGYRPQATVSNYTKADIDVMVLEVYRLPNATAPLATKPVNKPDLTQNKSVEFSNLQANTAYRVVAKAYKVTGETATLISDDAKSQVVIAVANDEAVAATIAVQLVDVPFGATTTAPIDVKVGGYSPKGPETITINQ